MGGDTFDAVVVGGGHNALTLAAYLTGAGLNIAVVERNAVMGGGCNTEEVTLPGFKHSLHSNYHFLAEGPILADLELHKYGLSYVYPEVQHAIAFSDGTAVCIHQDPEKTAASFARFSRADADRYRILYERFGSDTMRQLINSIIYSDPLSPHELQHKVTGPVADELFSYAPLTLHQAVDRNFEHEKIRCVFKCFLHAIAVENTPGTGVFFPRLFSRIIRLGVPVGGAVSVARALERVVSEKGGTLVRGSHVERILVEGGRAAGVQINDGRVLRARRFVASGVDAPQTVRLAGTANFSSSIVEQIERYDWAHHSLVSLHLALNERPRYAAEDFDPDVANAFSVVIGADSGSQIDHVFNDVARGHLPARLAGNGACPSLFDPSVVPDGKHLAFWWPWAPFALDGDAANWDRRREEISDIMLQQWGEYAPNLTGANVLDQYLFTPLDISRKCINMVNGSHHVGAYTAEQLGANRPIPALGHYRTPIEGLYLCGSSSHTGGSVSASPGYNAANAIASDLGIKPWWTPVARPELHHDVPAGEVSASYTS
ncbi:MAG: NAD(P)/FAD-dependent oxidoreductase [Actinobacteria bacterium]|nr:NAD(P)/FAD-dependent oxidoreductase [Actinomycetota bacterium]